jgi:hypothetical protein
MVCEIVSVHHDTRLERTNSVIPEFNDEPQSRYVAQDSPPMVIDTAVEDVNSVRRRHRRRSGEFRCDRLAANTEN